MKIQTNIPPRRDGTVTVRADGGETYVFKADASGALTCHVEDEALLAHLLLRGDDFEPADAADYDAAHELVAMASDAAQDEADSEPDDDEVAQDAPPVEANTPPKASARPRRAR